ncbi:hypothetical protein BH11ARM1_BH11ARM1_07680 [soil metagenome]
MEEFYVELGGRIASARRAQNITQGELAETVKLTRTSITNIEKGRQKVLAHTVVLLASALSIEAAALLPQPGKVSQVDRFTDLVKESILKAVPELSQGGKV